MSRAIESKEDIRANFEKVFEEYIGGEYVKREAKLIACGIAGTDSFGALEINTPNKILLYGLNGSGKEHLAKTIVRAAGLDVEGSFIYFSAFDLMNREGISGADNPDSFVNKIKLAKECAPSVIYIDHFEEIIGIERDHSPEEAARWAEFSRLMLNEITKESQVYLFASVDVSSYFKVDSQMSNRLENVFDKEITIGQVTLGERIGFISEILKERGIDLEGIYIYRLARFMSRMSEGMTYNGIRNLMNDCLAEAALRGKKIDGPFMLNALCRIEGIPKGQKKSAADTAFHEAAHAVLMYFYHRQPCEITIVENTMPMTLGYAQPTRYSVLTEETAKQQIRISLAGRAGEVIYTGKTDPENMDAAFNRGADNDYQKATEIAYDLVCRFGINGRMVVLPEWWSGEDRPEADILPEKIKCEIWDSVNELLIEQWKETLKELNIYWRSVEAVAETLIYNGEINDFNLIEYIIRTETPYVDEKYARHMLLRNIDSKRVQNDEMLLGEGFSKLMRGYNKLRSSDERITLSTYLDMCVAKTLGLSEDNYFRFTSLNDKGKILFLLDPFFSNMISGNMDEDMIKSSSKHITDPVGREKYANDMREMFKDESNGLAYRFMTFICDLFSPRIQADIERDLNDHYSGDGIYNDPVPFAEKIHNVFSKRNLPEILIKNVTNIGAYYLFNDPEFEIRSITDVMSVLLEAYAYLQRNSKEIVYGCPVYPAETIGYMDDEFDSKYDPIPDDAQIYYAIKTLETDREYCNARIEGRLCKGEGDSRTNSGIGSAMKMVTGQRHAFEERYRNTGAHYDLTCRAFLSAGNSVVYLNTVEYMITRFNGNVKGEFVLDGIDKVSKYRERAITFVYNINVSPEELLYELNEECKNAGMNDIVAEVRSWCEEHNIDLDSEVTEECKSRNIDVNDKESINYIFALMILKHIDKSNVSEYVGRKLSMVNDYSIYVERNINFCILFRFVSGEKIVKDIVLDGIKNRLETERRKLVR